MNEGGRRKPPRYVRSITLGNILTMLGMAVACVAFFLGYNERFIRVEAAQISAEQRDGQFRQQVLQRLSDLQTDVREIRAQNGVSFRELPPSRYPK